MAGSGESNVTLEEYQAEAEFDLEDLNRALQLLALWARRRGEKLLNKPPHGRRKSVTVADSKAYSSRKMDD